MRFLQKQFRERTYPVYRGLQEMISLTYLSCLSGLGKCEIIMSVCIALLWLKYNPATEKWMKKLKNGLTGSILAKVQRAAIIN
jgi:hypothetical protein